MLEEIRLNFISLLELDFPLSVSLKKNFFLKKLINNSLYFFLSSQLEDKKIYYFIQKYSYSEYLKPLDLVLWKELCCLSLFYSSHKVSSPISKFCFSKELFQEQIAILLENYIINIANSILRVLLNYSESLSSVWCIFFSRHYLSPRNLRYFKNNLLLSDVFDFYIYSPRVIYENKYLILNFNHGTIISNYIYCYREQEFMQLSITQLFVIGFFESQDLLLPQIKAFVYLIGKAVIYILSYLLGIFLRIISQNIKEGFKYIKVNN
nr:hypothetical protein [Boldiaceae sp.]